MDSESRSRKKARRRKASRRRKTFGATLVPIRGSDPRTWDGEVGEGLGRDPRPVHRTRYGDVTP